MRALVLELVEGDTLADRITRGAIPLDEALPIAKQIAEALEAADEQGVIHRDLKPSNIKGSPDGVVKVLDFGLAKLTQASGSAPQAPEVTASPTITSPAAMTGAGTILGTAAYMALEQAKGRAADKRSDVWAFGCVLYEMLTGKRAFQGEDVSDTLAAVLRAEPDWTSLPRDVPASIRALLEGCLTKDRRQRIADISAALFVIRYQARLAAGTDALRVLPPQPRKSFWRRALPYVAAVAVTAAGAGYTAWALKSAPERPVARFSITLPEGESFTNVGRHLVALSPDGARLAYAANDRLYLRALDQLDAAPMWTSDGRRVIFSSDRGGGASNLYWQPANGSADAERLTQSPNVQQIAATVTNASGRDEIYVRPFPDVHGGQWQVSTAGGEEALWARSGRELFYRAPDGAVMGVSVDAGPTFRAGTPKQLIDGRYYDGDTTAVWCTYDISPDGRRFLMIKNPEQSQQTAPPSASSSCRIGLRN